MRRVSGDSRVSQQLHATLRRTAHKVCYKKTRKAEGGKREESKQETKRHTQGADLATQAEKELRTK
jgi:hypothetical protein